jgi:2,4-dienoyl-CoA reductase-like NADH-dependent reductase (Old Yellow Enzyme family)
MSSRISYRRSTRRNDYLLLFTFATFIMSPPILFAALQICDLTLKNRVVVAPMHQYSAEAGFATDWHLMLERRAGTVPQVQPSTFGAEARGLSSEGQ